MMKRTMVILTATLMFSLRANVRRALLCSPAEMYGKSFQEDRGVH